MLEEMANEAITRALPQNPCVESNSNSNSYPPGMKKKRNLPGTPDPEAEVVALSPKTLMATNRFLCEICGKGFQRDQNLQLHRRGHNLPWKLRQRSSKEVKKRVYVCPEKSCVHHHPSRALGDLTGIKKHFCRKHGEKTWKCEKCSKRYAVQSDWKAHSKTCGTREYRCDCGTLFSRRDSFVTHRAFCDALAEETARVSAATSNISATCFDNINYNFMGSSLRSNMVQQHLSSNFKPIQRNNEDVDQTRPGLSLWMGQGPQICEPMRSNLFDLHKILPSNSEISYMNPFASFSNHQQTDFELNWAYGSKISNPIYGELASTTLPTCTMKEVGGPKPVSVPSLYSTEHHHLPLSTETSATALLQKAAQMGVTSTDQSFLGNFAAKCNSTQAQDGSKYHGLFTTNQIITNYGTHLENSGGSELSALAYPSKRQNTQKDGMEGAQTRDFLGVSIDGWI